MHGKFRTLGFFESACGRSVISLVCCAFSRVGSLLRSVVLDSRTVIVAGIQRDCTGKSLSGMREGYLNFALAMDSF